MIGLVVVLFVALAMPPAASAAPSSPFGCTEVGAPITVLTEQPFNRPAGVNYTLAEIFSTSKDALEWNLIPWDEMAISGAMALEDTGGHISAKLHHLTCRGPREFWVEMVVRMSSLPEGDLKTGPISFRRTDGKQLRAIGYNRDAPAPYVHAGWQIYLSTPALISDGQFFTVMEPGWIHLSPDMRLSDIRPYDTDKMSMLGVLAQELQEGGTFVPDPWKFYRPVWAAYLPLATR